jgi:hypothetical protein
MAAADLVKHIQKLVTDNSTAILTGMGVAGTISTAVLTGRATVKATRMIDWADSEYKKDSERSKEDLDLKDKVKLVWKLYIPPVTTGVLTITSIVMANRLATKQASALAAACSLTERALSEYREKVIEKIGENKESDIRDSMVQARMSKNPVNTREVILAGTGEVLCYDTLSGRYFQSSIEEIKRAENEINYKVVNYMHASLSEFYDLLGLPATGFSDTMGFDLDHRCIIRFTTEMSTDGRPAVAIDYVHMPVAGYDKHWE